MWSIHQTIFAFQARGGWKVGVRIPSIVAPSVPVLAYDSPEAYDRAAHAALSFAAADLEWGEGCDIFTPAAEVSENGWAIRRHRSPCR